MNWLLGYLCVGSLIGFWTVWTRWNLAAQLFFRRPYLIPIIPRSAPYFYLIMAGLWFMDFVAWPYGVWCSLRSRRRP